MTAIERAIAEMTNVAVDMHKRAVDKEQTAIAQGRRNIVKGIASIQHHTGKLNDLLDGE